MKKRARAEAVGCIVSRIQAAKMKACLRQVESSRPELGVAYDQEDKMGKTFKFKDLMINVGPLDKPLPLCQQATRCNCVSHLGTVCLCASHPATCGCTVHITCLCVSNPVTCAGCSIIISHCECASYAPSVCGPLSGGCGPSFEPQGDPEQELAGLSALKDQLKQQLAEVEKQEQATEESLHPQTVAEADELQQKLQGALEELKAHRAELMKKEKEQRKEPSK